MISGLVLLTNTLGIYLLLQFLLAQTDQRRVRLCLGAIDYIGGNHSRSRDAFGRTEAPTVGSRGRHNRAPITQIRQRLGQVASISLTLRHFFGCVNHLINTLRLPLL